MITSLLVDDVHLSQRSLRTHTQHNFSLIDLALAPGRLTSVRFASKKLHALGSSLSLEVDTIPSTNSKNGTSLSGVERETFATIPIMNVIDSSTISN